MSDSLQDWADVAINFVIGQGDQSDENEVDRWKKQGIGNVTILRRLINKLYQRAVTAESLCQDLEDKLVSLNYRKNHSFTEVFPFFH